MRRADAVFFAAHVSPAAIVATPGRADLSRLPAVARLHRHRSPDMPSDHAGTSSNAGQPGVRCSLRVGFRSRGAS